MGGRLLGWRTVCAVEIDAYRRSILLARQRDGILEPFPIWDDIGTFDGRCWRGSVDVVSGGFPCQDISHFGSRSKRLGLNGSRSGLWREMARVIEEVEPAFVLIENSTQIRGLGLDIVLQDLTSMGFDCAWDTFSAREVGAPHQRKRFWCLAYHARRAHECSKGVQVEDSQSVGVGWWTKPRESAIPRVDDGVADRLDRFAAIGDGQVPAVVELAWETLVP